MFNYSMILKKGNLLYTKENEEVAIERVGEKTVQLFYKGCRTTRVISEVLGKKLFLTKNAVEIESKVTILDLSTGDRIAVKLSPNKRIIERLPSDFGLPVFGRGVRTKESILVNRDIFNNEISDECAAGEALIGKRGGQEINYLSPTGLIQKYIIIDVQ